MTKLTKRPARKIWFVAHPVSQFEEDVKMLAMTSHLKIVDVKFAGQYPEELHATKTPKLTSLTEKAKAEAAAKAEEAAIEAQVRAEAAEIAELERKTRLEIEVRARVMQEQSAAAKKK